MHYIIKASLNQPPRPAIAALLPAERARAEELVRLGRMVAFYVSADHTTGWSIYRAESQADVEQILATLPLRPFLDAEITPLAE
jgi:muconolactone delta-isomerase